MESEINVQGDNYDKIIKAFRNFRKSPKDRITESYCETRLESLETLWLSFTRTHKNLVKNYGSLLKDQDYSKLDVYEQTEEIYTEYKAELKSILKQFSIVTERRSDSDRQQLNSTDPKPESFKLPKIVIPSFSGRYTEWITFRDLFLFLIHNNQKLDSVQKMHYLKSSLTGEAEQLLRQIPITDANYSRCWNLLKSRYDNKRYLSHYILKRLLSQRNITTESAIALKELIDTTNDCLSGLSNLSIDTSSWDIIVIHILCLKLDPESRKQWEFNITDSTSSEELPTYNKFVEFLTNRYRALEFLDTKVASSRYQPNNNFNQNNNVVKFKSMHTSTKIQCVFCSDSHRLSACKKFSNENVDHRRNFVQTSNLCYNCLGANHGAKVCQLNVRCKLCHRRHHTLLHPRTAENAQSNVAKVESQSRDRDSPPNSLKSKESGPVEVGSASSSSAIVTCNFSTGNVNQVLLATALINTESKNGSKHVLRALLDQGSQGNFVTEAAVNDLKLRKTPINGTIIGVGGEKGLTSKAIVSLKIKSRLIPDWHMTVKAYVLKSITSFLPGRKLDQFDFSEFGEIELADPDYNRPNKIDLLLGAEVFSQIIQEGIRKASKGSLLAQSTTLGWILSGTVNPSGCQNGGVMALHCKLQEGNELLKKFWELESGVGLTKEQSYTEEENRCENIYTETTTRDENGRYVVRLPFKTEDPDCKRGETRNIAIKRLKGLEKRFERDDKFRESYSAVMNEYLEKGYMIEVKKPDEKRDESVYLPHHAIVRNDKDTTKLRVVFNASQVGKNGVSLNDDLLVGPTIQPDLRHLVMLWRLSQICLSADIEKMYLQILVHPDDTNFQRLVWRTNPNEEIRDFKLPRVTFGNASAPFLAVRTLHQVAVDEGNKYPLAAEKICKNFYMDDLMCGCESVKEGIELYTQMKDILGKAGFKLQKWASNDEELLKIIKEKENGKDKEEFKNAINIKMDEVIKILGLTWERQSDHFRYRVDIPDLLPPITKRKIIADISRLFDPLGWVTPCIIVAKILIQKLWVAGIDWDDEASKEILKEWCTYRNDLKGLVDLKIPRWLETKRSDVLRELHGFCDASKVAYAAVVYLRIVDAEGKVHVSLIAAKSKVAPIKQVSIPRLELCGAVELARLMVDVTKVLQIDNTNLHAWTDSTIVLAWLNSLPCRWKVFVANRVAEILTSINPQQWSHVSTQENPADCASRGVAPSELKNKTLWLEGPDFLKLETINYKKPTELETTMESVKVHNTTKKEEYFDRFSKLNKLVRVTAYCRRFLQNKEESERKKKYLTSEEIAKALEVCIKIDQQKHFKEEIEAVRKNTKTKSNALKSLNPSIDERNMLRVGGRLENSQMTSSRKHPIVMAKNSKLTTMLIVDAHLQTLHGGTQLTMSYLQRKYFIIGAKQLVKAQIRKCVECVKNRGRTYQQLMGQLPEVRVTPARPFLRTGVDFAGPVQMRTARGRGHKSYKGYICLFVCMATRAVHVEAVSELTAHGFLQAFKRFVARRGRCEDIWSDNGTNFVGAAREIGKLFTNEKDSILPEIAEQLATNNTTWHFIPPHAPNFGGLWEAGIKSVKFHLKRVIGTSTLTYEEMATVLAQVEACLNSRPLSKLDGDQGDTVLTPGHFLVGEPLVTAPDRNYEASNVNSLRRWQYTQRMIQEFWRKWSKEYLNQFFHRYRWSTQSPQPKIGNIVLVKEDGLPPCKWLYGKVVDEHPGQDGITRVVTLKCKNSLMKRPTNKLCILPITE